MAGEIFYTLWQYIESGQFGQALIYTYNNYYPYGAFFWMFGIALMITTYLKTKNLVWSGAVTGLYFLVLSLTPFVTNIYTRFAMRWVGVAIGIWVGYYVYKMLKGG